MKKVLLIAMAISLLVAGMASATVVSSKHDLRPSLPAALGGTKAATYAGTQVCVFCHHPHRGDGGGIQNALLWNVDNDPTVVSWSTYSSGTVNGVDGAGADFGQLMGTDGQNITKACLSCHDGTTAIGSVVKKPADGAITATDFMPADLQLDTDTFEDDHPVDFTYPISAANGGLDDIKLAESDGSKVVGEYGLGDYPLVNGRMQCNTCHDVHDPGSSVGTSIQFLRGDITESEMCRDCHTSK